MNVAIVTGASSGLGNEFVIQIDKAFHKLDEIWVIARRQELLEQLQSKCDVKIRAIPIDLLNAYHLEAFKELLADAKPNIRMLVNSAGYGIIGQFSDISYKDATGMVALNCQALTAMTHLCLPYMSKNSRMIQMASSAAFLPQPGFAIYAATKSYVLSFSRALNREWNKKGIYVTAICPGPVDTAFFNIAEKSSTMPVYKKLVMADTASVVSYSLEASRRKKDMAVYGVSMKLMSIASKLIPHGFILMLLEKYEIFIKGE